MEPLGSALRELRALGELTLDLRENRIGPDPGPMPAQAFFFKRVSGSLGRAARFYEVDRWQKFKKSQLRWVQCWQDICREAGQYRDVSSVGWFVLVCFDLPNAWQKVQDRMKTDLRKHIDVFVHGGFDGMRCQ